MTLKDLQLIIFDMDGLMFDTERIAYASWREAAFNYGYVIDKELFKMTVGVHSVREKEIYAAHFGERFPYEAIRNERFRIGENSIKLNGVPIKSGLYELLDYLGKLHIKKAVATSTDRDRTLTYLKLAGIERCFDYVLCGDEVEESKPNPDIFLKVAAKLGCSPESCLVLEDSEPGILAAHRAGMLSIMIPDMKKTEKDIEALLLKKMISLHEVKVFLEKELS